MEKYRDLSGSSGVDAFELREGEVKIQFRKGGTYLYTKSSAGSANLDKMKRLARKGVGLNTFINESVRDRFAEKLS